MVTLNAWSQIAASMHSDAQVCKISTRSFTVVSTNKYVQCSAMHHSKLALAFEFQEAKAMGQYVSPLQQHHSQIAEPGTYILLHVMRNLRQWQNNHQLW